MTSVVLNILIPEEDYIFMSRNVMTQIEVECKIREGELVGTWVWTDTTTNEEHWDSPMLSCEVSLIIL